jgi:hypothetical protein
MGSNMFNLLESFLVALVTAGTLVGLASWLLLRYFRRSVDQAFSERERVLEAKLRRAEEYDEEMLVLSRQVLTEIDEVIYRSLNLVREIAQSQDLGHLEPLMGYWNQLSDHLFKYQLFVPSKTFDLIYKYKMLLQNLALRLGGSMEYTYEDDSGPSLISPMVLSEEDLHALGTQIPAMDELYGEIASNLSNLREDGLRPSLMTD